MVLQGQRVQKDRYTIIPRTLTFLLRGDRILLMQPGNDRLAWAGKFNAIGGHIEAGEAAQTSALREVMEETGLTPTSLWLAGTVQVDTGSTPGIGLYVFIGQSPYGDPVSGSEGRLEWVPLSKLASKPLVADLADLIPAALESEASKVPFSALTTFDEQGNPCVHFS